MSDHIAGLQSGHAKGDSETRQNGRSVRRRGTCSGYAYVSPGCGTGKWEYFQEMVWNSSFSGRKILESGYDVICAFSGLGLLPFALNCVGNSKDTGKTVSLGCFYSWEFCLF